MNCLLSRAPRHVGRGIACAAGAAFLVLTLFGCNTGTSSSGSSTPSVTGVTVAPISVDIWKGRTQDFAAHVEGANEPDQTVTWTVSNNVSKDTHFKGNILHVAVDETAEHFTVTATSVFDPGKSGKSNVNLVRPTVSGVTILETDAAIYRGSFMEFHATVEGPRGPDQDVVWSITGNSSNGTKFEDNRLTIARDEASTSWTIKATSYFDGEHSSTATVKLAYRIVPQHNIYGRIDPKYQDRLNEYVPEGGKVTIEINQEPYYKLKSLQYTDGSRTVPIDQTSRTFIMPASDITISAGFDELAVGDRGPGGGWIFYKNPNRSNPWRYLECAPTDAAATQVTWGPAASLNLASFNVYGAGKGNTQIIISAPGAHPAAEKAVAYESNGLKDWYLPSLQELEGIKESFGTTNSELKKSVGNKSYWSSTEEYALFEKGKRAQIMNFGTSDSGIAVASKNTLRFVRAIRLF